jgi:hypothetical protein
LTLRRHRAPIPGSGWITRATIVDQGESLTLGILESEDVPVVPFEDVSVRDLVFLQPLCPPFQRGLPIHTQAGPHDAARAAAFARHGPVEEREVGAWVTLRVGIEEVVRAHVILVDGPLHQPHPKRLRIEAMVLLDSRGNRGEMVDAGERQGRHSLILSRVR